MKTHVMLYCGLYFYSMSRTYSFRSDRSDSHADRRHKSACCPLLEGLGDRLKADSNIIISYLVNRCTIRSSRIANIYVLDNLWGNLWEVCCILEVNMKSEWACLFFWRCQWEITWGHLITWELFIANKFFLHKMPQTALDRSYGTLF